jgi:putative addiction module component (TIGR02574 family)
VRMDEVILEQEAMRLPARARALLADALLGSLDDEAAREIETEWVQEAEARLEAYRRGEISALDGPKVLQDLRDRLGR